MVLGFTFPKINDVIGHLLSLLTQKELLLKPHNLSVGEVH